MGAVADDPVAWRELLCSPERSFGVCCAESRAMPTGGRHSSIDWMPIRPAARAFRYRTARARRSASRLRSVRRRLPGRVSRTFSIRHSELPRRARRARRCPGPEFTRTSSPLLERLRRPRGDSSVSGLEGSANGAVSNALAEQSASRCRFFLLPAGSGPRHLLGSRCPPAGESAIPNVGHRVLPRRHLRGQGRVHRRGDTHPERRSGTRGGHPPDCDPRRWGEQR